MRTHFREAVREFISSGLPSKFKLGRDYRETLNFIALHVNDDVNVPYDSVFDS